MAKYGWKRDLPDHRDIRFKPRVAGPLPAEIDFRPEWPAVYDQAQLGSCTGNGWAGAIQFCQMRQNRRAWVPSRLFIYYCERVIGGTVNEDSGAQIRDGAKALKKWGVCPEDMWPYDVAVFTKKPDKHCYQEALKEQIVRYERIDNTDEHALMSAIVQGAPIIIGFSVYESFESAEVAKTGIVPMPKLSERCLGGHCVVIVGYKMINGVRHFIIRNSWGDKWGDKGYCYIPSAFLCNQDLASDFWALFTVE